MDAAITIIIGQNIKVKFIEILLDWWLNWQKYSIRNALDKVTFGAQTAADNSPFTSRRD